MILIAGLGNPGTEYANMRHNAGFTVLDILAAQAGVIFTDDKKSKAQIAEGLLNDSDILFVKPQTYMNESGSAVAMLARRYKISPERIVLVHDDLDIQFGEYKVSFNRSAGGHRGVASVIQALQTQTFWRLRIGLAAAALTRARQHNDVEEKKAAVSEFVLSRFTRSEITALTALVSPALEHLFHAAFPHR